MDGYLPQEITVDILQRLPPKSLIRFRSVCKTWNSLITDHSFICDHLKRTSQTRNSKSLLILQLHVPTITSPVSYTDYYNQLYSLHSFNQQTNTISSEEFSFTPLFRLYGQINVVGSCNGLVCVSEHSLLHFTTLIIWNPSIRKYMKIRKPFMFQNNQHSLLGYSQERCLLYGFGFDSTNMDYKVVRLVTLNKAQVCPEVEVYSLASASWRRLGVRVPQFFIPFRQTWVNQLFVNGALHWLVCRRRDGKVQNFILSFDVVGETFGELMLPPKLKISHKVSSLEGGHLLALLHTHSKRIITFFSIWVMKEYGVVESWMEVWRGDLQRYGGIRNVLAFTSNGKVVIILRSGAMVLLDPIKDSVKPLGHPEPFHAFAGPYVESLFLMNKKANVMSY